LFQGPTTIVSGIVNGDTEFNYKGSCVVRNITTGSYCKIEFHHKSIKAEIFVDQKY